METVLLNNKFNVFSGIKDRLLYSVKVLWCIVLVVTLQIQVCNLDSQFHEQRKVEN